jgi:hypothetical protein
VVESRDSQSWGNASTKGEDRGAKSGIKLLEVEVSRANEQTKVNRSRKQERVRRSKIGWMGLGGAVAVEWVGGRGSDGLLLNGWGPGRKCRAATGWKQGRREGATGLVAPSPGTAAGRQGMLTRGNRGAT